MKTEKDLLKDGYRKVNKIVDKSPCNNCQTGFSSYSSTELHGELYVKTTSCADTCIKLKKYLAKIIEGMKENPPKKVKL